MMLNWKSVLSNDKAAKVFEYVRKRLGVVTEVILLLICTIVTFILLLYALKYLWFLYTSTAIGQAYGVYFSQSYHLTNEILNKSFIGLALRITLSSFIICFIVSALFQFLHLTRYLYSGRGLIGKIVFFGLPLAFLVAVYLRYTGEFAQLNTAFTMAVFPVLGVFTGGFKLTEAWIPELSDVKHRVGKTGQSELSSNEPEATIKKVKISSKTLMAVITGVVIAAVIIAVEFSGGGKAVLTKALEAVGLARAPVQDVRPVAARFVAGADGTVLDKRTNLMWAATDNGEDVNWQAASRYCENYRGGGYADWRMPTPDELTGLYDGSKSYKASQRNYDVYLTELIQLSASFVWSSETGDNFSADYFAFGKGAVSSIDQGNTNDFRALPVRSAQ
jgi:hypothetical protein